MKMFLTSVRTCVESIPEFKELLNSDTKLVILPISYHKDYINSSDDVIKHFDRNPFNKESIFYKTVRPFIDAGIDESNIVVLNPWASTLAFMEHKITKENTILYLPGGYPEIIMEHIKRFKLLKAIKQCEVIVGESAGSMVISRNFFVYKDQDYEQYRAYKGLGLKNNITMIPHFKPLDQDILSACHKFSRKHPLTTIYCVEDGGYLIIENCRVVKAVKSCKY
jgi:peptidase E